MIQADAAQFLTSLLGSQLYLAYLAVVFLITTVLTLVLRPVHSAASGGKDGSQVALRAAEGSKVHADSFGLRRRAAVGSILAVRVMMAAAWWAAVSVAALQPALPGLERFASLVGLLLVAWALLGERYGSIVDPALAGALVVAALGLVGTLVAGRVLAGDEYFNRTPADAVWTVLGLLAAISAAAALTADPVGPSRPAMKLGATGMAILAGGFSLHLVLGPAGDDFPAFVRLSELAGYPVLCLALLSAVPVPSTEIAPQMPPSEAGRPIRPGVLIELAGLAIAENSQDLTRRLVRAVGRAAGSEVCLLLTPPNDAGRFDVTVGYDLIQEREVPGATLDRRQSPVLAAALAARRPPGRSRSPDSSSLRAALHLPSAGPALLAPLECDGRMFGALLLLSPYTRKEWTEDQKQTLLGIAPLLGRKLLQMEQASGGRGPLPQGAASGAGSQLPAGSMAAAHEGAGPSSGGEASGSESGIRRTGLQSALSGGERAAETDPFHRLAFELQLALRELAEARARLGKDDAARWSDRRPPDASRGELAAMAHNLRQPVSSGLGYADLLLGESVGLLGAVQRKFLERVRDGLRRVDEQLRELARAAAPDESQPAAAPPPIAFAACLEEAMGRAAGALRAGGHTVRADVPPDLPLVVAERNALTQILEHLIVHASGSSVQGAAITLRARPQPPDRPAFLQCTVTDHDPGPTGSDHGRVAGSYAGRPAVTSAGEEGGDLPMVRALAEAAGGRIWVESTSEEGTSISVLLPISAAEPPAAVSSQT
jgi:signal transduction histidine kinase